MSDSDKCVKDWLTVEVNKLKSESQKEDWLTLREAINDRALMSASQRDFTIHMQFIHLQLLMGCVVKCCSGGLANMIRNPERYMQNMDALTEPIKVMVNSTENGRSIASDYSNAYGSSATNAGAAMIGVLQNKMLTSSMSRSATQLLEQHLIAQYAAYRESVERLYCAGAPITKPSSSPNGTLVGTPVANTGNGCLVCVAVCAVGSWAITHMLHVICKS